jgi:hypothetical protein
MPHPAQVYFPQRIHAPQQFHRVVLLEPELPREHGSPHPGPNGDELLGRDCGEIFIDLSAYSCIRKAKDTQPVPTVRGHDRHGRNIAAALVARNAAQQQQRTATAIFNEMNFLIPDSIALMRQRYGTAMTPNDFQAMYRDLTLATAVEVLNNDL